MTIFDYITCHNLKPYKMNNHNGWWRSIFQNQNNSHPENPHNITRQILMDWLKVMSTWYYHGSWKLVALELYNNCFYMVVIKLNELHMYTVSHMMNYIHYNSYDLSNNTHTHKNTLSCKWLLQFRKQIARLLTNHFIFS